MFRKPFEVVAATLLQDPCADVVDQFTLLGGGDQRARSYGTSLRMRPPEECLHPSDQPVAGAHDRLVGEMQFAASECPT